MNGILILKGWMFASTQSWKTKLYYSLASIASVVHVLLEKKNWYTRGSHGIKYQLRLCEGIVKILPSVKGRGLLFLPSAMDLYQCKFD